MTAQFRVHHLGNGKAVVRENRRIVWGPGLTFMAETHAEKLARDARRTARFCICCQGKFLSEGAHNRMCDHCRETDGEIYEGAV